jgi:hypothetical protein
MDRVTLHKPNGTTITYKRASEVVARDNSITFEDEKYGAVKSTLPYQVNYDVEVEDEGPEEDE